MSNTNLSEISPTIQRLTLADLPVLELHPALSNAHLLWCSRRHFSVGGVDLQFEPVADVTPLAPVAIWMQLDFAGAPCVLGLSAAWASALIQSDGWTLESLDDASLDLWCQTRWARQFPAGLLLTQSCFKRESLGLPVGEAMNRSAWIGRHVSSREISGHQLQLWTPDSFPVMALAELVGLKAKAVLPSPLSSLPITLPMVAARWSVDAQDLVDLAVGDLLLVG